MSTKYPFYFKFTLYHVLKGNKPDFHNAMGGEHSEQFYNDYLQELKKAYDPDKIKGKSSLLPLMVHSFSHQPHAFIVSVIKRPALKIPDVPFSS